MAVLGIVVAVLLLTRRYRKRHMSLEKLPNLAIWAVIGGLLGARVFHIVDYWAYYTAHPLQMFSFNQGGLAIWGALVGGFVFAIVYLLVAREPLAKIFDLGTPAVLIGLAIGRIGCTINGDAWGAPTGGSWGLVYTDVNDRLPASLRGVPTHPFPVYEMVWDIVVAVFVWKLGERMKLDGRLTLLGLGLYAAGRFVLNFVRQEQVVFLGMQQAQVVSLAILIVAIIGLPIILWRSHRGMPQSASRESLPGPS